MIRRALVVGAAGGVGTEVTRQLIERGYAVTASVLDGREAASLRVGAPAVNEVIELDLADGDGVLAKLERHAFSALDAVVVCAAVGPTAPVELASLASLRRTLEINTVAAAAIYIACLPALRAAKGRLVMVSSFAGKVGLPFFGHYVASKFALEGLGDVMRREAKADGVDVILIEPGGIKTPMVWGQVESVARERAALSAENAKRYGAMYDGFLTVIERDRETLLQPSVVAQVIVEALHAHTPQARYQVGGDSKSLCELARKSDAEIDAALAGFLG